MPTIAQLAEKFLPERMYFYQGVCRKRENWKDARIIFIHIPKNAGTSINRALYGSSLGHFPAFSFNTFMNRELLSLPTFCVTRNPWDRIVSAYHFAKQTKDIKMAGKVRINDKAVYSSASFSSFKSFVQDWLRYQNIRKLDNVFKPQAYYLEGREYFNSDITIFKMDEMDRLVDWVYEKAGIKIEVKHENKSFREDYRNYYDQKTEHLIGDIYEEDVAMFGYQYGLEVH